MDGDYDVVEIDEFDALSIEMKAGATIPKLAVSQRGKALNPKFEKYPAKTHARKVAKELGFTNGLIYLPGQNDILWEDSDMPIPFRQRRYFYYLSGANFPGCAVTYDIAKDYLTLWIPCIDPKQTLWFGTVPSVQECKSMYDVDEVSHTGAALDKYLTLAVTPLTIMFVLRAELGPPKRERGSRGPLHVDVNKLKPAMDAARVVKTDYEVAQIRKANSVSSEAHKHVLEHIKRLDNESQIETLFRARCSWLGTKEQSYDVIAGSGPNAATLHYGANNQALAGRQLVVLDAGSEWNCYASDITRTFPINGKFTPEAAAIYAIVERMQEECIAKIKPGYVFYKLHLHALFVATEGLLKLGILHNASAQEMAARGIASAFFPHGLGHHVGLEVHDVSGREKLMLAERGPKGGKREFVTSEHVSSLARDAFVVSPPYKGRQQLEKNMIVTIEPGIYFCRPYIESLLANPAFTKYVNRDVLERYYPVGGCRIEDCILVTDIGYENLTSAPKGKEALKIINGK